MTIYTVMPICFSSLLRSIFFPFTIALLAGCATLFGPSLMIEQYMACPKNTVWNSALDTLDSYPTIIQDQSEGIIKTDWRNQPVADRPYGLFRREGLRDKERSRLTFSVKPIQEGIVVITLTERRHHWGFRGGARLYEWYPVEPSQPALHGIMNQLTTRLHTEGCLAES